MFNEKITICRHFNECGGCSFQDTPYNEQVENKKKLLSSITNSDDISIIRSPKIYGFRNKMEYSFESGNLGLHPQGRFDKVIDLKECPVFSEWIGDFLDDVRKFAARFSVPYYSRREKKGILRYLIVRESKFTKNIMVILVVDGNTFNLQKEWVDMVKKSLPDVSSIVLARRHLSGDSSVTEDYEILEGKEFIEMKVGDIRIEVSPFSFWQPNSYLIEGMYNLISHRITGGCRILDFYTGVGSIAFYLSAENRDITGVENYQSCIKDAERNLKELNPTGTVKFVKSTVRNFMASMREPYDYIILDPPREGMSYRIWKHLVRIQKEIRSIKRIFYICCSLKNLQNDLDFLRNNTNWNIRGITGVDQYVHTPHLETVVEIEPVN